MRWISWKNKIKKKDEYEKEDQITWMNRRSSHQHQHQHQVSLGGNTRRSSPSTNFADRTTSPVFICERISLPPVVYLNNTSKSSSPFIFLISIKKYVYKQFFWLEFKRLTQILKIDLHQMTALLIQTSENNTMHKWRCINQKEEKKKEVNK